MNSLTMCTDKTVCTLLLSRVTLAKNALAPVRIIFLAFSAVMTLGVLLEVAPLDVKLSLDGSLRVIIQVSQSIRSAILA